MLYFNSMMIHLNFPFHGHVIGVIITFYSLIFIFYYNISIRSVLKIKLNLHVCTNKGRTNKMLFPTSFANSIMFLVRRFHNLHCPNIYVR